MIDRRTFLGTPAALAAQSAPRPNILWICTDQQRGDTLDWPGTPNLAKLSASGVTFTRTYCQNPICTPSRASFMTGCYPSHIHVHRNGNAGFPAELAPLLLPHILREAGYDTGLVGKLHLSAAFNRVEQRPDDGYRIFEWTHHPKPESFWPVEHHAYQRWLRDKGANWDKLYRRQQPAGMPAELHEVAWAGERIRSLAKGELRGPWFASMHVFAPHPPHDPSPEFLSRVRTADLPHPLFRESDLHSRFDHIDHQSPKPQTPEALDWKNRRAAYYAQIEQIDYEVGRILDSIDRANTIVVFTSDHGEMLADHGLVHKGARFYEGAVRVPLIISWPGRFRSGLRHDGLVELTDVLPTLLEAVGLKPSPHVQGRSLLPILQGTGTGSPRDFVRAEYYETVALPNKTRAHMIRTRTHKLVRYAGTGVGELYNLAEDPDEFDNLWDKDVRTRGLLSEQLLDELTLAADIGTPRIGRF